MRLGKILYLQNQIYLYVGVAHTFFYLLPVPKKSRHIFTQVVGIVVFSISF